jgi:transposase
MDPREIDETIWRLIQEGLPIRKIASLMKVGQDRVSQVKDAMKIGYAIQQNRELALKITQEIKNKVIQLTLEDSLLSDESVARILENDHNIKLHRNSVNRIRSRAKFFFKPPKICQLITPDQKQMRIQFAHDYLTDKLPKGPFVFSDESRFCRGDDKRWRWRSRSNYRKTIFLEKEKYSRISVMVWGAIGIGFKSRLCIFPSTVNSKNISNVWKRQDSTMNLIASTVKETGFMFKMGQVAISRQKHLEKLSKDATFYQCGLQISPI